MSETLDALGGAIVSALPNAATGHAVAYGELAITANAADIVKVVTFLRDDPRCQFWCIIDVTAVDWPAREKRFDIVYHFLSPKQNTRIRVKIETDEATPVPSIVSVFPGAEWFERETWDMYGIVYDGHPALTRILMPDDWDGFPQRKDYPLGGIPVEYKGAEIPPPDQRRAYS